MIDIALILVTVGFFALSVGYAALATSSKESAMSPEYAVGLILAALLGAYLLYALVRPERF